jgi:CubicO group peptidase (beta-lactamase class C family)
MKPWLIPAVAALQTFLPIAPACAADRFDPVRVSIREHLLQGRVPSVVVAVAKGNSILWEEGFGWADREKRVEATPNIMYSLASITKPLTATALMTLVRAGKIDLDRPVNDYLGEAKLVARVGDANEATVRRLANHSSGLAEHYQFFYVDEPWRKPSPDEAILHYGQLFTPPGEHYEYSNLGYGVLSYVVSRLSGQPFPDYLRAAVFLPLGMTRSTVGDDPVFQPYEAVRYGDDGQPIALYETDHDGASAAWASAHDLVRFGMFNLKLHLKDQAAILPDESIDAMHRSTVEEGNGDSYGTGWEIRRRSGYSLVEHTGDMPGVAAVLRMAPTAGVVVVVLCNAKDFDFADDVANQVLGVVLPNWRTPVATDDGPTAQFLPPPMMVGVWSGRVETPDGARAMKMNVLPSGEVRLKIADQGETLVRGARMTSDGYFRGTTTGDLAIHDGARRAYVIGLRLRLRDHDRRLTGEVTARADRTGVTPSNGLFPAVNGHPAPTYVQNRGFVLAHWAELTKP